MIRKQPPQSEALTSLSVNVEYIKRDIQEIKQKLEIDYVRREEFEPIKKGFYALAALVFTAVVGAVMTIILK